MKTMDVHEKSRLSRAKLLTLLALLAVLLAAVTLAPSLAQEDRGLPDGEQAPAEVVAQDPDFDTVDDPLNGEYELFTVDDLVLSPPHLIEAGNDDITMQTDIFILETENEKVSSQLQRNLANPQCAPPTTLGSIPQFARVGRFFALPYDVVVTVAPTATNAFPNCDGNGADNMALYVDDAVSGQASEVFPFAFWPYLMVVAKDDFNQDGFADLFILSQNQAGTNAEGIVATAADINDRSQGLTFGPKVQASDIASSFFDPVTGDFNADGLLDVAWIAKGRVRFATVCPGDTPGTLCAGKDELEIIFDPLQSQNQDIPAIGNMGPALAAGHFVNEPGDGLIVFDTTDDGKNARATWFEFNGDFSIEGGAARDQIGNYVTSYGFLDAQAEAAPLNWLGDLDQVVFAYGGVYTCSEAPLGGFRQGTVGVISFTSEKMSEVHIAGGREACTSLGYLTLTWMNGLAVGHFADIADNPSSNSAFNLQFATYNEMGRVRIYTINMASNSYTPVFASEFDTAGVPPNNLVLNTNWMASGDLQGRSEHLGAPSVIRVESHSQPSVVLGAPPMHVDYIQPDTSTSSSADIINFSAVPSAYQSSYTMSQTSSNQSSDTSTTSYTYATAEESQLGISLKPPYLPSVSGKIKTTTSDKNETVNTDYAFRQNEFTYNASTATGFGDEIWVAENSFNLYVYPVLGETVCPSDNSNCAPDEEVPLYVTFSGPNSSGTGPTSGATTEWYQPLHEPGNILSYPWNQSQLTFGLGGIERLLYLTDAQWFMTDDASQVQTLNWSQAGNDSVSAGAINTHSYERGYSITAGKQIGKILDINFDGDLDYSESSSLQTLNQSTSSMGASQGIAIAKPSSFLNQGLYRYRVEPYILGRKPDQNSVDNPTLPEKVQAYGPLQASFAVNPLESGGSWWSSSENPYAQAIDVALNHPVRWTHTTKVNATTLNCLGIDCLTFNDPDPNNLWNSEFYWMRGLFVAVDGQSGPQRTQATAGDIVYLTARVYNYSLLDMPSGSKVKARFYRQEINGTLPSGNSVLIDEVEIDGLVGFNSSSAPNWATASASFDTTTLGGTTHIFWVVVWAEDGSGAIISEVPGHGLSATPGTLNGIGDVPLEMVALNGEQKTFSNNVGYLHSKFYIAPAGTQAPEPLVDPELAIEDMVVMPSAAAPGEKVIVSADITSLKAASSAVTVQFFPDAAAWQANQQDPTQPAPRAFDIEQLPYIGAGELDVLEVPFRSSAACGIQEILMVARASTQAEAVTATATLDIGPCQVYFPVVPLQLTN